MKRVLLTLLILPAAARAEGRIDFNRDVRPILSDACFSCHGFDAKARKGRLRLDVPEGAFAKRKGGVPLKPGDPKGSEVWARITAAEPEVAMPPPDSNKKLTAAQKETIRKWIEQGARYQSHWAFEPIRRPPVPATETPNAIDAFLVERLRKAGLAPRPRADRETLIRRVAFTLTGLPPTPGEVEEFLADRTPSAYEKMIDRYLASPRYGEEMARHWLDVARYADTHGLHLDNERQMWAYRDWVVRAFNDNLSFDRFTVWQVAGDLLPEPTTEQLVATGFNRCNVTTSEGGAINAEFAYRYAVERTTAVAQAWMGLTAGCAVCHDHKFDPLSMKEFYGLYAFFNSAGDPAMDGNINVTPPFLKLLGPRRKAVAEAARKVEQESRNWLDVAAEADYIDPAGLKAPPHRPVREVLFDDAFPLGATSRSSSRNAVVWVTDPAFKVASGRRAIKQAHAATCNDTVEFKLRPIVVPSRARLEVQLRVDPLDVPKSVSVGVAGGKSVSWERAEAGLRCDGSKEPPVVPGRWVKLTIPLADLGLKAGDRLGGVTLGQAEGIAYWDALTLTGEADPATDPLESFSAWRKALGAAVPPELPEGLHDLVRQGAKKPFTPEQAARLRTYYLAVIARPVSDELAAARSVWEAARVSRIVAEDVPGTFIYKELEKPRDSFVMMRGQYDRPGEKVEPGGPAALPPIRAAKPGARLNRLDLANWLVTSDNPLTARVTVNRLWQQVFGTGLVKTSFDFGSQGEPPSHPELLDWLAYEFRESGWDVKKFMKLLLLSDAFRRDARLTPEVRLKDPANRLLARGPRFRLDAEQVRDNALFVSGLMDLRMGGRGVKPYQPPNIWEPVGYTDSNTRFYQQDHGPALYRRSVYVFLKRTAPPPFLSNFDGPNREQVCTVRERSNTPMQALQLLNDVQFFEAARALAERAFAEGGKSTEERIAFLYRAVLSRRPDAAEVKALCAALARQLSLYRADPAAARKVVHVGESKPLGLAPDAETAAWAMIANLILNLDETVNRN